MQEKSQKIIDVNDPQHIRAALFSLTYKIQKKRNNFVIQSPNIFKRQRKKNCSLQMIFFI